MKYLFAPFWCIYLITFVYPVALSATLITAIITIIGCTFGDHKTWGYYPAKYWSRLICIITFVKVEIEGRENIQTGQSYVFAANHTGQYDIYLIYGYLNIVFKWIMKKELIYIPFVGYACKKAGHIFINRAGGKQAFSCLQTAQKTLSNGVSVVIFPEGARTPDGKMGRFKRGAMQIAQEIELPIIPLTIIGGFEIMPLGAIYPHPGVLKLIIHPPIAFNKETDTKELIDLVRNQVKSAI